MAESTTRSDHPRSPQSLVPHTLHFLAAVVTVLAVISFLVYLADVSTRQDRPSGLQIVVSLVLLAAGLALAAGLLGLAAVVRQIDRLSEELGRKEEGPSRPQGEVFLPAVPAAPAAPPVDPQHLERMARLLEEIRDNVLLTDEERRRKRERLEAMERRERAVQIQQALDAGEFHRARQLLLELERRVGGDETTRELAEHIEEAARQAEAEDVAAATRQVEDLMSLTAWERAIQVANGLIDRHPDSLAARQLLARVQRERQVHQQEHRNRLHVDIQRHVSRREWRRALELARQLIDAYPESVEAEALRAQMDTLRANAEIEHRKELEAEYKRLCEQRRFDEALALAREVVATYPDSPQARVLRQQIPQLEKRLAAEPA